jgi:hypothetical protein
MITSKKLMTAALAVAALTTVSIAASGDAFAKGGHGGHGGGFRGGFHGGAKFFHGGRHHGHRFGHRNWRGGYGYAYNTCWQYTPYGLVNVCLQPY